MRGPPRHRRHFRPKPITVDGIRFDSTSEAGRYGELKMRLRVGEIRDLEVHPKLAMVINGKKVASGWITLDFRYEEHEDGAWREVYEDYKGIDTSDSKFRRAVCEAIHNIKIRVTTR